MIALGNILEVTNSYDVPQALLSALLDANKRADLFNRILSDGPDLGADLFCDFFQEHYSDRKGLKQDFTPQALSDLTQALAGSDGGVVVDVCAGSGSMTIKQWGHNKGGRFYCFELSKVALPFLLCNLAIRGMRATVIHGDVITREAEAVYEIMPDGVFSEIVMGEPVYPRKGIEADVVLMNPPFSVKWNRKADERTEGFGEPPSSKADYLFLLDGLSRLKDDGTLVAIYPHGVLFRGAQEKEIRKRLIELNLLDAVIGMPPKLFLNTDIPVCVMVVKRYRDTSDTLIVDASRECEHSGRRNVLRDCDVTRVVDAYKDYADVERFAHRVSRRDFEENDFNLNIPRYVDTYEPKPVPDALETLAEMLAVDREIRASEKALIGSMQELCGGTPEKDREIRRIMADYKRLCEHGTEDGMQMVLPL